jgi:hypothetical protein
MQGAAEWPEEALNQWMLRAEKLENRFAGPFCSAVVIGLVPFHNFNERLQGLFEVAGAHGLRARKVTLTDPGLRQGVRLAGQMGQPAQRPQGIGPLGDLRGGPLEGDSNLVENDVRPSAVGKRRWLFIGHADAGWRSAIIYTLIQSCRHYGISPQEYLTDVLGRLPSMTASQVRELLPARWRKTRQARRAEAQ